jgi:hypothetical protein
MDSPLEPGVRLVSVGENPSSELYCGCGWCRFLQSIVHLGVFFAGEGLVLNSVFLGCFNLQSTTCFT